MDKGKQPYTDSYEEWVKSELEKGNYVPVENSEEWKTALESAAESELREELPVDPKVETGWKLIEMIAKGQISINGG